MKNSMVKRLVSMFLVILVTLVFCGAAFAEGDAYDVRDERYPDKHWIYMTPEEIASYEAIGWQRICGVLWYDTTDYSYTDFTEINDPQELINEGYVFHIIYTWVCPGEKLGKYVEQSVSAGYWQLNADEIRAFLVNYEYPTLTVPASKTGVLYESNWAKDGAFTSDPDDSMSDEELQQYSFVRIAYNDYNLGYGEDIVLLSGDVQVFTLDEAVAIGGFDSEMPRWN